MNQMLIAVAVDGGTSKVTGHAGRSRHWLVFAASRDGIAANPRKVVLEGDQVFHHFKDEGPHPLDGIAAVITLSAGEGFVRHMEKRGAEVAQTAETDPAKAASDFLHECLSAPRPRPIGSLICKALDLFSRH